jgi:hypothetical protein
MAETEHPPLPPEPPAPPTPPTPPSPPAPRCQNCETPLIGRFCHACGQRDFDFHRSFSHVARESVETWFNVDSSFLVGAYNLLFRPGLMTRDYNEGRRARHVPPLRFYLVVSLLFFLWIGLNTASVPEEAAFAVDGPARSAGTDTKRGAPLKIDVDNDPTESALEARLRQKLARPHRLLESFIDRVPTTLLLCLPIFALVTRFLFRKGGWVYLQHLILSVHVHTFIFLWWVCSAGWTGLVSLVSSTLAGWIGVPIALYPIVAYFLLLARCFPGKFRKRGIILRGALAAFVYFMVLALAFVGTMAYTLFE